MRWILRTLPPYFSCRSDCYVTWRQRSIFRWMPFSGKDWRNNSKRPFRRQIPRAAIRATVSSFCTRLNSRFPFMFWIFGAAPPNLFGTPASYIIWSKLSVFGRMPFSSKLRKKCGKRVCSVGILPSAKRTTVSTHGAIPNRGFPFM